MSLSEVAADSETQPGASLVALERVDSKGTTRILREDFFGLFCGQSSTLIGERENNAPHRLRGRRQQIGAGGDPGGLRRADPFEPK